MKNNRHVDVVIVRTSPIPTDPRVRKIATSLAKRYNVVGLGWDRDGLDLDMTNSCSIYSEHCELRAPSGTLKVCAFFPFFWIWVFIKLCVYRPEAVHSCDLDTILPSMLYTFILRKKLIFDVFDRYAHSRISPNNKVLYSLVKNMEERVAARSTVLINVSGRSLKTFGRKPKSCYVIMNCMDDIAATAKTDDNPRNYRLTLCYTGTIIRCRGIERVIDAIKSLTDVRFVFAGRIIDHDLFNEIVRLPNVEYKGILKPIDALSLEASCDVIIALYDLNKPNNRIGNPNKLFEAMMLGKAIICNMELDIIREAQCGIAIENYENTKEIEKAISLLRDDASLRLHLGKNGKKYFGCKYNWRNMEKILYKIYNDLLTS